MTQIARQAVEAKADLVVAIGGGSRGRRSEDRADVHETRPSRRRGSTASRPRRSAGSGPFRTPKVRMIAIPSTLSGGEYNSGALVTDTAAS